MFMNKGTKKMLVWGLIAVAVYFFWDQIKLFWAGAMSKLKSATSGTSATTNTNP